MPADQPPQPPDQRDAGLLARPEDRLPPGRPRRRRALRWGLVSVVLVVVVAGAYVWTQVRPLVQAVADDDVSYTVPQAPRLVAGPGETVYRIDPTQSEVAYTVDEKIVGQSAGQATGTTSGIAGDIALNPANPTATRVGTIVVDVQQLHSDNNLRDARIRHDFLESHQFPLAQLSDITISGLPASPSDGADHDITLTGTLTAHGRSVPTTWTGTAGLRGGRLAASASTTVAMSDLGVGPISLAGLVSTGDDVRLDIRLVALDPSTTTVPERIAAPARSGGSGDAPSFRDAVQPVLEANCASCHATGEVGAAHWTLDTAGDAARVSDGIGPVTASGYMPPWPASDEGVPLAHSKKLSQADVDTLVAWSRAGGPLDVPADTPVRAVPSASTVEVRHDLTLPMPDPYTGSLDTPNDYRCFVLDPGLTAPTYVTGYEVTPGQREEIHHVQIFHVTADQAKAGADRSGADGRPGWSCYAGPGLPGKGPAPAATGQRRKGFTGQGGLIAGWVPGQDPSVYPEGSGILFQPGDAIVLQVHYHYAHTATPDRTTVALQTEPGTASVRPIDIVNPLAPVEIPCMPGTDAPLCDRAAALADNANLYGPSGALIEAGLLALCRQTPEGMTQGFAGVARSSCDYQVPLNGDLVAAMGHMHTLGRSFRLTLDPGTDHEKVLLDIPAWNFDWQMNYQLAEPLRVQAGQTIRMDCSWDRSIDPNRPPKYIVFAEGTEDEMCFSTYALIPDP